MKNTKWILASLLPLALGIAVLSVTGCKKTEAEHGSGEPSAATKYTCPMHPEVVQDKAGDCPKCGMKLVEKK